MRACFQSNEMSIQFNAIALPGSTVNANYTDRELWYGTKLILRYI